MYNKVGKPLVHHKAVEDRCKTKSGKDDR